MSFTPNNYRVRIGDDGATCFQTEDPAKAIEFARDYSETNWAGKAQILDRYGKAATFEDGRLTWVDRQSTALFEEAQK